MATHASQESIGDDPEAPRQSPRGPAWLPRILLESVLVVLSVLLALAVDEWRDERRRAGRADIAMQSIRAELEENRRSVERARAGHLAMRDSLAAYARADQLPPARLYLYGIFNPALVHSAAWESARETGATGEMPYDLVLRLSRVYDDQERYRTLAGRLVQDIMTDVRRQGTGPVMQEGFRGFMTLQEDFSGRERTLLTEYEQALAALDGG